MRVAIGPTSDQRVSGIAARLRTLLPSVEFVDWQPGSRSDGNVEALLTMSQATRADMEAIPGLLLVQTLVDGYELVDIKAADALGIWVGYVSAQQSGNADSVAEFALLLLLAAARRINVIFKAMRAGTPVDPFTPPALVGKTACIVGFGSVGQQIAQRLLGFGVRVTGVDRSPPYAPKQFAIRPMSELKAAVADADFVFISVRATAENKHLFDADVINAMKRGSILVNVARGSLLDSHALLAAVQAGCLSGAGLDVTENEPIHPDDPLLSCEEIVVTPHVAGYTSLTVEGIVQFVADVLQRFADGERYASILNEPSHPRKQLHRKSSTSL